MAPRPKSALDRALEELIDRRDGRGGGTEEIYDDADIDKRVAELLVQEAREKNEGVKRRDGHPIGYDAESSSKRHTTNTRFLNNVVRGVQSHNRALLNVSSSPTILEERGDDAVGRHKKGGESSRLGETRSRRDGGNDKSGRMRGWSDDEKAVERRTSSKRESKHADRKRGGEGERTKRRHSDEASDSEEEKERRHRRRKEERRKGRSTSPDRTRGRHHHHSDERSSHSDRRAPSRRDDRNGPYDPEKRSSTSSRHTYSPARDNASPPSKMDRYFAKNYDPMLDVKAEVRQDADGLVEDDGWDRMLKALREKEERKRARKNGESSRSRTDEGRRSHHRKNEKERGKSPPPSVGTSALDTHYTSRGGTREWDRGKESSS